LDLLADLNEPQRRAVTHVDGPLLVLAGAGSGKTRVITRRVAHLVAQGVAPWNILAITFTNKAAGEMKQRVEALGAARGATVSTFHALCARLLREFAREAGLSPNYSIYDRDDQLKLVKQAMERLSLPSDRLRPASVHAEISRAKNELKDPASYGAGELNYFRRAAAEAYVEYEKLLAANHALDFDDLLLRTARLLRDRPDIRRALGERYRYILIDEYQDTNHAQYLLAHGLAMDHENICATGDPDQSIYAWRGADIRNILEFEQDYPNATVVRLEENYRSTQPILAAASRLISHNAQRKHKELWTRRTGGPSVRVAHLDDEKDEARYLARRIRALSEAGTPYSDIAVFYRINALSRVVEEALLRETVPYRVARGTEFYNRREIKDVLAYVRLLVNGADDLSCRRVINTPARGIGGTTVKRLESLAAARGLSLLDACRMGPEAGLSAAAAKKTAAFAELIASLAEEIDRPVREILEDVVRRTGLEDALGSGDEDDAQADANIEELISAAADYDEKAESSSLAEWLHQVSLVSDADHFEGDRGAVTLMTLHAAKGLEFPAVFGIGWEQGVLPFERGEDEFSDRAQSRARDKLEEERRLAFVGMTRAKNELTLTCVRRRRVRGRLTSQAPSPFLDEIGHDGVAVEDLTTDPHAGARHFGRGGFYADAAERALIEASADAVPPDPVHSDDETPPYPPEYEYLRVGSRVRHPRFGDGSVTRLRQRWPDTRADVTFDRLGPKTLVLAMTSLEVL